MNRVGYTAKADEEWYLSTDSSKTYDQTKTTYTAIGIANAAGCNLKTTSSCTIQLNVNWTRVYPTLTVSDKSGSYNCNGGKVTYKIKSSVAGTFTISSSSTTYATVSPTSKTVAANTTFTVTVTGKKSGEVTITNSFKPTDTAAYGTPSAKTVKLTIGKWKATGGGSQGTKCSTAQSATCTAEGKGVNFCCMHNCNVNGVIHSSVCTCVSGS